MVDEFSNFARMPKPAFRDEDVHEIARQALFLHEVAHPGIRFLLEPENGQIPDGVRSTTAGASPDEHRQKCRGSY